MNNSGKITTNNHRRDLLAWHELTEREQDQFSHYMITSETAGEPDYTPRFVRYKGNVIDTHDGPTVVDHGGFQWIAFPDTYWTADMVRFVEDEDDHEWYVICGQWTSSD